MLADRLRFVAGRYWQETQAISRKGLLDQLNRLTTHAKSAVDLLGPAGPGPFDVASTDLVMLLSDAVKVVHNGQIDQPLKQLEMILSGIEHLEVYCEQAHALLSHIPGKKGQRGLAWYGSFVELLIEAAGLLGIPVTTAGDRIEDPYATPFTVLAFALERALPKQARSRTLAACAKRIDRSLAKKRPTTE